MAALSGLVLVLMLAFLLRGPAAVILVGMAGASLTLLVATIWSFSSGISASQKRFLILYALALLTVFNPFKAIGQLSAMIFLLGLIGFAQVSVTNHIIKFLLFGLVLAGVGAFYAIVAPEFSAVNYLFFVVTASSLLLLLCNFTSIATPQLLGYIALISMLMLGFQASYGVLQAIVGAIRGSGFDVGNGDLVRGTIEPSFEPTVSASNPIFAILISSLLIFAAGVERGRPPRWRIALYTLGLLAWVLASVMHTILFFMSAMLLTFVVSLRLTIRMRRRYRSMLLVFLGAITFIVVLVPLVLPTNVANIPMFLTNTLDISPNADSEKARAIYNTLALLPTTVPYQPLIGLGPGHYSSRASLIRSGEYLGQGTVAGFPPYITEASDRYILPLWRSIILYRPGIGSTYFPFSSWLSLYGELGLIGVASAGLLIGRLVWRLRRLNSQEFPYLHLALIVLVFYLALLGFQDNYWEFTQAVFPAFLLFKLGYDYLNAEHIRRRQVSAP